MSDELVDVMDGAASPQAELASFERGQASLYASRPRYGLPIARANLRVLCAASIASLVLLVVMLVQRSLEAGMNEHLVKPVEPARIHEALQKLLGGQA